MFLPLETGVYTLPNVNKLFHYNLTMSPLYLVKLKITPNQPTAMQCILLNRLLQTFKESRPMFVSFLSVRKLLWQSSGSKSFTFSWVLSCKLHLNCRDL